MCVSPAMVQEIIEELKDFIANSDQDKDKIYGMGVGIPGIIENEGEIVRWTKKSGRY